MTVFSVFGDPSYCEDLSCSLFRLYVNLVHLPRPRF